MRIWTCLVGLAVIVLPTLPALAEGAENDWLDKSFTKSQSTVSVSKSTRSALQRAARDETSERPSSGRRAAKVARGNDGDDDGSRPQRKSSFKPRPSESLSGGSGETGVASYYWEPQALASGGRFNPNAMTAAHKTLPFGTRVRVTHLGNGNSVDVVINDRGPYIAGRIIDLSKRAAQDIGMTGSGVARVKVAILGR